MARKSRNRGIGKGQHFKGMGHLMTGDKNPFYGKKHTEESLAKMRAKRKLQVFSKETRELWSKNRRGKKIHNEEFKQKLRERNWKGGITSENRLIRRSPEYKLWRTAVFERDSYQCIWGGKEHGNQLNADHIKPFAHYPELRFAIDNGRTLCKKCHAKTDTYGSKSKTSYYQKL